MKYVLKLALSTCSRSKIHKLCLCALFDRLVVSPNMYIHDNTFAQCKKLWFFLFEVESSYKLQI